LQIGNDALLAPKDSKKRVRNLRLVLSYDGSEFAGWQVQPGLATVQGTLASAIGRLSGENVLPQGSGRTDAGVHALGQVATFTTQSPIPLENWLKALNEILPPAIRVLEAEEVPAQFHARKSARAKTYRYRIHRAAICPPFLARYVWHYPYPLDETVVAQAAEMVIGEHDFTSFAAVDPERKERAAADENLNYRGHRDAQGQTEKTNVRTIFSSSWAREADEFIYTVRGSGFLHHMVRNLVGTFVLVGKGTLKPENLRSILAARDRSAAGPTAPASGLYLVNVEYDLSSTAPALGT
jgi:tRNA pseudouridine38-40 synthase